MYGNVPQVRILSSPPKPENPAFYAGFLCFGGEDRDEGVPCGSRVGSADIRRGSHACVGNGVILSDSNEKALPYLSIPHFMRDFLCFGGEDRAEGVPCGSRVGSADIRRGSRACVGNGVILSDSNEKALPYLSVPHFMRDFLYFGGEDRAERVPCGSRV